MAGPDLDRNRLLAALPEPVAARLRPRLEPLQLPAGHVLEHPAHDTEKAFFPVEGIVALLHVMDDGASTETALVGREGLIGVASYLGGASPSEWAVTQTPARVYGLEAAALKREFDAGGEAQRLLLRYTQALLMQHAQTAACNRRHTIDQQLCRWLLLSLDRASRPALQVTQAQIARLLGVRRVGITASAQKLQDAGLIRYSRGHIAVLDREGLEQHACECYRRVRGEYDRLLPETPDPAATTPPALPRGSPLRSHAEER